MQVSGQQTVDIMYQPPEIVSHSWTNHEFKREMTKHTPGKHLLGDYSYDDFVISLFLHYLF